jgi:hypothetical protein
MNGACADQALFMGGIQIGIAIETVAGATP